MHSSVASHHNTIIGMSLHLCAPRALPCAHAFGRGSFRSARSSCLTIVHARPFICAHCTRQCIMKRDPMRRQFNYRYANARARS